MTSQFSYAVSGPAGGNVPGTVVMTLDGAGTPQAMSATTPLPVTLGAGGSLADRSGTVAAGGVSQQLMAANATRVGFSIQNLSGNDLWFSGIGTAAAAQPSMKLSPGALYESAPNMVPKSAISIFGATTGQPFAAREY